MVLFGVGKGEEDEGFCFWELLSFWFFDVLFFCLGWKEYVCVVWNSLDGIGEKEVCMFNVLVLDVDICWR